jgi:hypothetical protein
MTVGELDLLVALGMLREVDYAPPGTYEITHAGRCLLREPARVAPTSKKAAP